MMYVRWRINYLGRERKEIIIYERTSHPSIIKALKRHAMIIPANQERKMTQWEHTTQGDPHPTFRLDIHPLPKVGSYSLLSYPPHSIPSPPTPSSLVSTLTPGMEIPGQACVYVDTRHHIPGAPLSSSSFFGSPSQ
jgi:hypothetical protein